MKHAVRQATLSTRLPSKFYTLDRQAFGLCRAQHQQMSSVNVSLLSGQNLNFKVTCYHLCVFFFPSVVLQNKAL